MIKVTQNLINTNIKGSINVPNFKSNCSYVDQDFHGTKEKENEGHMHSHERTAAEEGTLTVDFDLTINGTCSYELEGLSVPEICQIIKAIKSKPERAE